MQITITDSPDDGRFEARADSGAPVGFVQYRRTADAVVLLHTEVDGSLKGQGVGSRVVRATLDGLLDEGVTVVNECPFIGRYLDRHPGEYEAVVRAG